VPVDLRFQGSTLRNFGRRFDEAIGTLDKTIRHSVTFARIEISRNREQEISLSVLRWQFLDQLDASNRLRRRFLHEALWNK